MVRQIGIWRFADVPFYRLSGGARIGEGFQTVRHRPEGAAVPLRGCRRRIRSSIAIGDIAGPYEFDATAEPLFRRFRRVRWLRRRTA
jgi:hypothetical protein